jgi:O-methyltransferase
MSNAWTFVPGPLTYAADGLWTVHNADFAKDPKFTAAYKLGAESDHGFGPNLHVEWRTFVNCWAAESAASLPGDFVECGTNSGIFSRAITSFISFEKLPKTFYLMDTFTGFPEEQYSHASSAAELEQWRAEVYKDVYADVKAYFSKYPNVVLIKGTVPGTLAECPAEKIAYLSIDMNAAPPEIAALDYFWDKIVPGGIVVLDDYGWPRHEPQKAALDAFAQRKETRVLALPTGQGLMIKR